MTTKSETSAPSRLWRILFLATSVHFVIFGLMAFDGIRQGFDDPSILRAFHPTEFGLPSALALWLFLNSSWVMLALLAADLPALLLLWNLSRNRPSRKIRAAYFTAVLGLTLLHAAAIIHTARIGLFRTPHNSYEFSGIVPAAYMQVDLLLTLPAWTMLAAALLFGWPRQTRGLCPQCNYDLRATPDRCPECGAAVTAKAST